MNGVFAIPRTRCFENSIKRNEHFGWHYIDFSVRNASAYERMADTFLSAPKSASFFECFRSRGDLVRYDRTTNQLGVISKDGIIRTYYTPRFCAAAPLFLRMAKKCHNEPTHEAYVRLLCSQH